MRSRTARLADWALSRLIPIQPIDLDAINEHINYVCAQEAAKAQAAASEASSGRPDGLRALGSPPAQ